MAQRRLSKDFPRKRTARPDRDENQRFADTMSHH
jgi:hypothetical protein